MASVISSAIVGNFLYLILFVWEFIENLYFKAIYYNMIIGKYCWEIDTLFESQ